MVRDPLENPAAVPVMIRNPDKHSDYAKEEVVAGRVFHVPGGAVERAVFNQQEAEA